MIIDTRLHCQLTHSIIARMVFECSLHHYGIACIRRASGLSRIRCVVDNFISSQRDLPLISPHYDCKLALNVADYAGHALICAEPTLPPGSKSKRHFHCYSFVILNRSISF